MFGIDDPQVWLAYLLCIAAAAFAAIYGALNWNKGDEVVHPEDKKWVEEEKVVEEQL
jgi:drug/metabolite transporter (DMT)-like permease